jgi:hypothetical protein
MKIVFSRLQDLLTRLVPDAGQRLDVLTTAMALAHSRVTSIPSGPVPSPAAYYNTQVMSGVDEAMAKMNEHMVFDLKCARNEARQFWLLRYAAAHPSVLPVVSAIGFIDTICGAGTYMDQDLICFCNEHKEAILRLSSEIIALIECENEKVA